MDKLRAKPKHTLKLKISLSNLIKELTNKIKSDFCEIDLELVKKDINLLVYLISLIDEALATKEIIDRKVSSKLDKNELLTIVLKNLFPGITDDELADLNSAVQFILDNKLNKKKSVIIKTIKRCFKIFFQFLR